MGLETAILKECDVIQIKISELIYLYTQRYILIQNIVFIHDQSHQTLKFNFSFLSILLEFLNFVLLYQTPHSLANSPSNHWQIIHPHISWSLKSDPDLIFFNKPDTKKVTMVSPGVCYTISEYLKKNRMLECDGWNFKLLLNFNNLRINVQYFAPGRGVGLWVFGVWWSMASYGWFGQLERGGVDGWVSACGGVVVAGCVSRGRGTWVVCERWHEVVWVAASMGFFHLWIWGGTSFMGQTSDPSLAWTHGRFKTKWWWWWLVEILTRTVHTGSRHM